MDCLALPSGHRFQGGDEGGRLRGSGHGPWAFQQNRQHQRPRPHPPRESDGPLAARAPRRAPASFRHCSAPCLSRCQNLSRRPSRSGRRRPGPARDWRFEQRRLVASRPRSRPEGLRTEATTWPISAGSAGCAGWPQRSAFLEQLAVHRLEFGHLPGAAREGLVGPARCQPAKPDSHAQARESGAQEGRGSKIR